MTSSVGTHVSTIVVGLLFVLLGIVKTVRLNNIMYKEMLKTFKNFTDVSPLRFAGVSPTPHIYMQSMGVFELILGTTLIVGTVACKRLACILIMAYMVLTTYCQLALKDYNAADTDLDWDSDFLLEDSEKAELGVLQIYADFSYNPPDLAWWSTNAMLLCPQAFQTDASELAEDSKWSSVDVMEKLALLLKVSKQLNLDASSPYKQPMNDYIETASRLLMHLYLERFADDENFAYFTSKLNEYFSASDPNRQVQLLRFKFVKLILSASHAKRYLEARWYKTRSSAFRKLHHKAWNVAKQFPEVILDKIGSFEWKAIDEKLLKCQSAFGLLMRQHFLYKKECTQADISELIHIFTSQSVPSQIVL